MNRGSSPGPSSSSTAASRLAKRCAENAAGGTADPARVQGSWSERSLRFVTQCECLWRTRRTAPTFDAGEHTMRRILLSIVSAIGLAATPAVAGPHGGGGGGGHVGGAGHAGGGPFSGGGVRFGGG